MKNPALNQRFAELGEQFYRFVAPTPYRKPMRLLHYNTALAAQIGVAAEQVSDPDWLALLDGQRQLPDYPALAQLYAGHQFGQYVPQLGDGRAITVAELASGWEIQLKGAGPTPFSRAGDGRAVLRSSIREYLCSEAMQALGIASTRALCLTAHDDEVYRESIEPGAIVARVAPSFVRFGSFEVFFYRHQYQEIRQLADFVIEHYYPECRTAENPYVAWLAEVLERTASLIAQWQAVGFCHGVMNSDNMSILGLTLDYGPFGFMEAYDPGHICNHSDHHGRYAYDQQPEIGLFNLSCLAQALLPILHEDSATAVALAREQLGRYQEVFVEAYAQQFRAKLGLQTAQSGDQALLQQWLDLLQQQQVDFTLAFRHLAEVELGSEVLPESLTRLFQNLQGLEAWVSAYRQRLAQEQRPDTERRHAMQQVNPKYILRNYLAEQAIRAAQDEHDYSELERLFTVLQQPYAEQPEFEQYAQAAPQWACGLSVSCSS